MTEQVRRAARLHEIERLLGSRPGGMTATELANRLDVSSRTIQRDIAVLESELNIPLMTKGRRYYLMPGSRTLVPIRFTLHEARAIYLATRLFLRHADESDPDGVTAIEKLAATLPESIAQQVTSAAHQLKAKPQNRRQVELLRTLTEAWAASQSVNIDYQSASANSPRRLTLDPYLLEAAPNGAATYVIGYSHEHDDIRTFKLDRIHHVDRTKCTFVPRDVKEIVDRMALSWGVIFGDDKHDVTVDFSPAVAHRIRETNWHPSQQLSELEGGWVRMQLQLPSFIEFVPWVRSWGPEAVVVAPDELRVEVAESLRQAASMYGDRAG